MSDYDSQEPLRLMEEVEDMMKQLEAASDDDRSGDDDGGVDEEEREAERQAEAENLLEKQREKAEQAKTHLEALENATARVEYDTRALTENRPDLEVWREEVANLKQRNFDVLLPLVMDEEGTLDRFRHMSSDYKDTLFNIEKEIVEKRLNAEIASIREAHKQHICKLEEQLQESASEIARLKKQLKDNNSDVNQRLHLIKFEITRLEEDLNARNNQLPDETMRDGNPSEQIQDEVLGMARYFMMQSGQAQDPQIWIPFVKAVAEAKFTAASQQAGEDRAWTIVRPWFKDGAPLPTPPADLMNLLVRLCGRIYGGVWDDETIETVRALTTHMEQAPEAPIRVVAQVVESVLEIEINKIRTHLVCFGLWQLALVVQRRWDGEMAELASQLGSKIVGLTGPLRALRDLLGSDCGRQLKVLIRERQDPYPGEAQPGSSAVAAALARLPVQFCQGRDIGLLSLPESDGYIWVMDLQSNTIRLVRNDRKNFRGLRWKLEAVDGDGEDIQIPCDTFREMDWVSAYLDSDKCDKNEV
ncbi:uncharacterized protein F4817DRAFT_325092 [Daldinia loculata]|uniref:uncharacterized protein n=1 Tax=Daldinia loculata TaxID=103429 RepID=UPI0020C2A040|nr:uncharacterized protein F4817DRAFT_325092 [Daldinia loculata]KAI1651648.1 hypothetical protein F4817DRAFT_325092 [Daldinia loculata]